MTSLEMVRAALRDLLELVADADACELMPDAEPYKAEAVWNYVLTRAQTALNQTDPRIP